jgi:hypothetical protein
LGATKADVKFLKGEPTEKDGDIWSYITYDSSGSQWENMYRLQFNNGKVYLIYYTASPNYSYSGPGIQGINIHYSWEKISEKYGEPSRVSTSEDELSRVYSFNKYGIAFEMKAGGVVGYGVFDPTVAPKGLGFASEKSKSKNPVRESR